MLIWPHDKSHRRSIFFKLISNRSIARYFLDGPAWFWCILYTFFPISCSLFWQSKVWSAKKNVILWTHKPNIFCWILFYETQSVGTVDYIDFISAGGVRHPQRVYISWHSTIWWRGSRNAGIWGNAEYPFIALAPRSTLAWRGSTW